MYEARFETEDGRSFRFGYPYGSVFSIDPLSELDVALSTSQGFQQVGVTVESADVGGLSRTIAGRLLGLSKDQRRRMLEVFTPYTSGTLWFNDRYYCRAWVQKDPAFGELLSTTRNSHCCCSARSPTGLTRRRPISWAATPPPLRSPVCYDSHTFGVKSSALFSNCRNDGMVSVPHAVQFSRWRPGDKLRHTQCGHR